jgi:purine-binding chemotaxis protein CheW
MTAGDDVQLVGFRVAGQEFAFNIFQVERILRYEAPAPLPKAPAFLEGVLQYQGIPVPIVDLRKRLNVDAPQRDDTRIVVIEAEGHRIGVVVDTVTEVMQVQANKVTAPGPIVKGLAAEYITGLVTREGRTVIVLNTGKLLSSLARLLLAAMVEPPPAAMLKS